VRGIVRLLPGRQVALGISAIGRLDGQRGVVAVVALVAAGDLSGRCDLMRIRQRKSGVGVIEGRISPEDGVVALRADRGREASGDVVWDTAAERRSTGPGGLVTTVTIRVGQSETVVVI